jgi:hypothetical protein
MLLRASVRKISVCYPVQIRSEVLGFQGQKSGMNVGFFNRHHKILR